HSGQHFVSTIHGRHAATLPGQAEASPLRSVAALERLGREGYAEAVLRMGAKLADGLAHAHERGIVHRDLKPANVLLADDGTPLLLDFNLSHDEGGLGSAAAASAGGTLPYMAPEQLEAFRQGKAIADPRCDLYSLGLILLELLTGKASCKIAPASLPDTLDALADQRSRVPETLASLRATPAVRSLLAKCLAPDPAKRYQRAADLREDFERHLADQPLKHAPEPSLRERFRKWRKRHPRLAVGLLVGSAAAALVAVLAAMLSGSREENARAGAMAAHRAFLDEAPWAEALLALRADDPLAEEGRSLGWRLARRWGADEEGWQDGPEMRRLPPAAREEQRTRMGGLLALLARAEARRGSKEEARKLNALALACHDEPPQAVLGQRDDLAGKQGTKRAPRDARDFHLAASETAAVGQAREAMLLAQEAVEREPRLFPAWFLLGTLHAQRGDEREAASCFGTCAALEPRFPFSFVNRGLMRLRQRRFAEARRDFDAALALRPGLEIALVHRAFASEGMGEMKEALADLDRTIRKNPSTRSHLHRARVLESLHDPRSAEARKLALRTEPATALDWAARGHARIASDPRGALKDFDKALALDPACVDALMNKAHVLSERLSRPKEAVAVLGELLRLAPSHPQARGGRAVLLARQGKREEALADIRRRLEDDDSPLSLFQAAGCFALASKEEDKREAMRLLGAALRRDPALGTLAEKDSDLDPVRKDAAFAPLVAAAKALANTP
ncbi:MAG: protein kinase, partial [Gemmataceae bacterium]|nr:protein kinase [Gemmataceae bacterium]